MQHNDKMINNGKMHDNHDTLLNHVYQYINQIILAFEAGIYKMIQHNQKDKLITLTSKYSPFLIIFRDLHEIYYTNTFNSMVKSNNENVSKTFSQFNKETNHTNHCLLTILANVCAYVHLNLNRNKLLHENIELYQKSVQSEIDNMLDTIDLKTLFASHQCLGPKNDELVEIPAEKYFINIELSVMVDNKKKIINCIEDLANLRPVSSSSDSSSSSTASSSTTSSSTDSSSTNLLSKMSNLLSTSTNLSPESANLLLDFVNLLSEDPKVNIAVNDKIDPKVNIAVNDKTNDDVDQNEMSAFEKQLFETTTKFDNNDDNIVFPKATIDPKLIKLQKESIEFITSIILKHEQEFYKLIKENFPNSIEEILGNTTPVIIKMISETTNKFFNKIYYDIQNNINSGPAQCILSMVQFADYGPHILLDKLIRITLNVHLDIPREKLIIVDDSYEKTIFQYLNFYLMSYNFLDLLSKKEDDIGDFVYLLDGQVAFNVVIDKNVYTYD